MELFKVAETPSTITIGWSDPPPGTQGYLFFARGKQVSRTFAPGRRSVRCSKGSEPYKVEAVTFVKVGEGTYPSAPVTYSWTDASRRCALQTPVASLGFIRVIVPSLNSKTSRSRPPPAGSSQNWAA